MFCYLVQNIASEINVLVLLLEMCVSIVHAVGICLLHAVYFGYYFSLIMVKFIVILLS